MPTRVGERFPRDQDPFFTHDRMQRSRLTIDKVPLHRHIAAAFNAFSLRLNVTF
ncbi:hypothetical protein [Peristeroidobacter agariperforans]|uniref:hypothetical protein n=1 Tax=Peristeroidobacter agariperforans TaxID=268404 RepID=UPI0013003C69|nr:hypothetical protein [Peristeroidobacter agariperforans]